MYWMFVAMLTRSWLLELPVTLARIWPRTPADRKDGSIAFYCTEAAALLDALVSVGSLQHSPHTAVNFTSQAGGRLEEDAATYCIRNDALCSPGTSHGQ